MCSSRPTSARLWALKRMRCSSIPRLRALKKPFIPAFTDALVECLTLQVSEGPASATTSAKSTATYRSLSSVTNNCGKMTYEEAIHSQSTCGRRDPHLDLAARTKQFSVHRNSPAYEQRDGADAHRFQRRELPHRNNNQFLILAG